MPDEPWEEDGFKVVPPTPEFQAANHLPTAWERALRQFELQAKMHEEEMRRLYNADRNGRHEWEQMMRRLGRR